MDRAIEIVVVGSHAPGLFMRVKEIPTAGQTVIGWDFQEPVDGGKGSNQAIASALLGGSVAFVGRVGRDRIGDLGEAWLRNAGVDTRFLRRSESTASGVGFILLDDHGVPAMVTSLGANAELSQTDVEDALREMTDAKVLLTQFEIAPRVALYSVELARRKHMTTIVNPAPAPSELDLDFRSVDILVPNEIEALQIMGMDPRSHMESAELARTLRMRTGAATAIVTLGEQGIAGADEDGTWLAHAPSLSVVDTSGAGDSYCAALAVGLLRGQSRREASEWACRVAALSVTKAGTIPAFPTVQDVERANTALAQHETTN